MQISCSFVVDALEALSGTCGLYLSSSGRRWLPLPRHLPLSHQWSLYTYLHEIMVHLHGAGLSRICSACSCIHTLVRWDQRMTSVQVACCTTGGGHSDGSVSDPVPQHSAHLPVYDIQCGNQFQAEQRPHSAADCIQLCRD